MSKETRLGCLVTIFVFVFFFGVGCFAFAGGLYLLIEGIKHFSNSFWQVLQTVIGGVVCVVSPVAIYRTALKYRALKVDKGT